MEKKAKILVVEDDLIAKTNLEILLSEMGYHVEAFTNNAIDALVAFSSKNPNLVIADISLESAADGIDLVRKMNEIRKVPVLFLTAHHEEEYFLKAKSVSPFAFITKPIDRLNLERSILLALESSLFDATENTCQCHSNFVFTRVGNRLKKIYMHDIEFVEVDGKYCTIQVGSKSINCKISLKEIMDKLTPEKFIQVSRNFLINIDHIEDIDIAESTIKTPYREVPISRVYKDMFFSRMKII